MAGTSTRRATFGVALVLLAAAVALAPAQARAAQWPQFHGSNDRTGYNLYESTIGRGNVAAIKTFWRRSLAGTAGDPVIANGVLYVGTSAGVLAAFDAWSGAPLWSVVTGAAVAAPGVANGVVYVASNNVLSAFDARTGAMKWIRTPPSRLRSPAVAYGKVYVSSEIGDLYTFDAGSGAPGWTATTRGSEASPAVANGVVYTGSGDGYLNAFDAGTGQRLWQYDFESPVGSPAVVNGTVYAASRRRVQAFGGSVDSDGDSIEDSRDNCRLLINPDQDDADGDRVGNACDNAPFHFNPYQQDADRDGLPDVLDPDDDNDGVVDEKDNCQFHANPRQEDSDGDGIGDACPEGLGLDRDLHFAFVRRDEHFERFQIDVLPPRGSLKARILVEGELPLELRLYDPRGELIATGTSGEPLHFEAGFDDAGDGPGYRLDIEPSPEFDPKGTYPYTARLEPDV